MIFLGFVTLRKPYPEVHSSGRVCLGFCASRSRPLDVGAWEVQHSCHVAKINTPLASGSLTSCFSPAPAVLALSPGA